MGADLFRRAWGNFATGASLITTVEADGSIHGMTANGIASVSLDPMLSMVCVGHNANTHPIIKKTGRYGINILSEDQEIIGDYYARSAEKRDGSINPEFFFTSSGIPFLEGALSSLDCKVVSTHEEGDHTIFIGKVEEMKVKNGRPLLFHKGKWSKLSS